ncbi:MAG: glycosyltransferase family 2 protein [Bacilli bacterium]|nr:glycosyltransferase family 2 protein [Bacilli bacterium]
MYQFIYYILFIPIFIYGMYFLITGIFAFTKKNTIKKYKPKNRLAVVVAARNEGKVIASLINSIKKQKYPKNLYDIFILPNNCTDNTYDISKEAGAKIIKCKEEIKSKGQALKYAFNHLNKHHNFDAYIIFDADNIVHPNFLARVNDALIEGYEVAQGFRDSKNPSDNWICGSYSLFYWGQNIFFNKSRMNMHASASINGTGFMIKRSVIEEMGFNTVTMTEDIEFTALCAINNKKIAFIQDAITYDEQPLTFRMSWKQRIRWSTGTYQCLTTYFKQLINGLIKNKNISCLDMLLFFMAPVIQLISGLVFILLVTYTILGIKLYDIFSYLFAYNEIFLIITYIISVLLSIFVVKYLNKNIRDTISGIIMFSIFLLSWIPINIICLLKKTNVWEEINHSRNISIETIYEE